MAYFSVFARFLQHLCLTFEFGEYDLRYDCSRYLEIEMHRPSNQPSSKIPGRISDFSDETLERYPARVLTSAQFGICG